MSKNNNNYYKSCYTFHNPEVQKRVSLYLLKYCFTYSFNNPNGKIIKCSQHDCNDKLWKDILTQCRIWTDEYDGFQHCPSKDRGDNKTWTLFGYDKIGICEKSRGGVIMLRGTTKNIIRTKHKCCPCYWNVCVYTSQINMSIAKNNSFVT